MWWWGLCNHKTLTFDDRFVMQENEDDEIYVVYVGSKCVLDLFFPLLTRAAFFPAEFSSSTFLFLFLSREFGTFLLFLNLRRCEI